jgi:hypothetical protein
MLRTCGEQRLNDYRKALLNVSVVRDLSHAGKRANSDPVTTYLDVGKRQFIEIDELLRRADPFLKELQQSVPPAINSAPLCASARSIASWRLGAAA